MTTYILKIIACTAMFIGHLPFVFPNSDLSNGMYCIGRLAFPIFAFLISEGYLHTKNFSKYLTRLVIFAIISQPFAQLLFLGTIKVLYFNIFFTLAIGLISIRIIDKFKNKFISYGLVLVLSISAEILGFDFGLIGVLLIVSFYVLRSKRVFSCLVQILLFIALYLKKYTYIALTLSNIRFVLFQLMFSIIALLFPYLYNGQLGKNTKYTKLAFYCFYPAHLAILCLLKLFV